MSPKKNKIRKAVSKEQKLENAAIARFTRILSRTKYQEHGLSQLSSGRPGRNHPLAGLKKQCLADFELGR